MGYSTSEFCRLCNVGREALRLYERMGILAPKVNPDNRYRSYDAWDASRIAEVKHYQALGFSLKEIREILENHDLSQTIRSMENSVALYRDKIRYYQMLCRKTEEELEVIRRIPEMLGVYSISTVPDLVFFSDRENEQMSMNDGANNFMRYLDFFMPCLRIDRAYAGDESLQDYSGWGALISREYAEYLGMRGGNPIPASKVFCTVIDAGEKGTISRKLFDGFFEALGQSHTDHDGTIYGALLTRTHDGSGDYHRYLFTFTRS